MKLRIHESGTVYFPNELREKGYQGVVELNVGVNTIVMEKPNASLRQIIRSLQNQVQAYRIRAQEEGDDNKS